MWKIEGWGARCQPPRWTRMACLGCGWTLQGYKQAFQSQRACRNTPSKEAASSVQQSLLKFRAHSFAEFEVRLLKFESFLEISVSEVIHELHLFSA